MEDFRGSEASKVHQDGCYEGAYDWERKAGSYLTLLIDTNKQVIDNLNL